MSAASYLQALNVTPSDRNKSTSMITLENRHMKVIFEPEHGAQIVSISEPHEGINALAHYDNWRSPTRARDGHRYENSTTDWLSNYRGGWQELFPNSGSESSAHDVTTPLHGEVSTSKWEVVARSQTSCTVRVGARVPLTLTRIMTLDPQTASLLIAETVTNDCDEPLDFIWGHHPVVPLIVGGRIDLPQCTVAVEASNPGNLQAREGTWPRVAALDGDADLSFVSDDVENRLTYQHSLAGGWVAYRPTPESNQPGIAMAWDLETWPTLWLWTLSRAGGFPWFGRAQFVGIEPNRSWPTDGLDGARGRNQQLRLAPGRSLQTWLTLSLITDRLDSPVVGVDRSGRIWREGEQQDLARR